MAWKCTQCNMLVQDGIPHDCCNVTIHLMPPATIAPLPPPISEVIPETPTEAATDAASVAATGQADQIVGMMEGY